MEMEHRCIKVGQKHSLNIFGNDVRERVTLEYFRSKSSNATRSSCPRCQLTLSISKYRRSLSSSNGRISKRVTSDDQQYLSQCLELIQISAVKAAAFNILVMWSPSNARCSTETFASPGKVSIFGSVPAGSVDAVFSPLNTWISDSETSSKDMIDIMSSPLFRPRGAINGINCIKGSVDYNHYGPPHGFSVLSSPLAEGVPENTGLAGPSISSILSTSSELSFCASTPLSQGMLQCTWSNGVPYFMFSTDSKPDVYVTRPSKSATSDQNSVDWTYLIYRWTSNKKGSDLIGRMHVSARYSICADSSKFIETESVLYGNNETQEAELGYSSPDMGKHRKFPRKVSKFFKAHHSPKRRPNTKMCGTSTAIDPGQNEESGDFDDTYYLNLLENNIASNFELAAIVIKEHIQTPQTEKAEVSGWGMSFLKGAKEKQVTNCHPSTNETSMDIIVPACHHGGPKTQNGGPLSLIERWRSGGKCDCGGWDIGCPITVLHTRPNKDYNKSLNLFLTGDEGRVPSMKLVNVQKSLYCIEFQPRLSALQCFSTAVAVIQSRCPTLRPQGQTDSSS